MATETASKSNPQTELNVNPVIHSISDLQELVKKLQRDIPVPVPVPAPTIQADATAGPGGKGPKPAKKGGARTKKAHRFRGCFSGPGPAGKKTAGGTNGSQTAVDDDVDGTSAGTKPREAEPGAEIEVKVDPPKQKAPGITDPGNVGDSSSTSKDVLKTQATAASSSGLPASPHKKVNSSRQANGLTVNGLGDDSKVTANGGTSKERKVNVQTKATATVGANGAALPGNGDVGSSISTFKAEAKAEAIATSSPGRHPASSVEISQQANGSIVNRPVESATTTAIGRRRPEGDNLKVYHQAEKLLRDLNYIESEFKKIDGLKSYLKDIADPMGQLQKVLGSPSSVDAGRNDAASFPTQVVHGKLQSLAEKVKLVKNHMPGRNAPARNADGDKAKHKVKETAFEAYHLLDKTPISDIMDRIKSVSCFKEFLEDFNLAFSRLDDHSRLCLLCLSIFPENAVVHKKLLVYWWTSEALLPELEGNTGADKVIKELCSKGFIKPVLKKQKLSGFQMDPLVRFGVIKIAEEWKFFSFNPMGVPTVDFSSSLRACLVKDKDGKFSRTDLTSEGDSQSLNRDKDIKSLHTLFNVNDPYPDFKLEWFSRLKMLSVLYLGGWQGSKGHHIEVEGTEFLMGLKYMKYLKFLSLQGISRIPELPDSLCELTNLKILDLNACHHLENLPKRLDQLKSLTHLDISECYLLDHIPKGLGQLTALVVLKGFVIGGSGNSKDSCTLDDLKGLKNLRKLSITSSRENFPLQDEVTVLEGFTYLKKLTIAWGGKSKMDEEAAAVPVDDAKNTSKQKGPTENVPEQKEVPKAIPEQKEVPKANVPEDKARDHGNAPPQKAGNKEKSVEQTAGQKDGIENGPWQRRGKEIMVETASGSGLKQEERGSSADKKDGKGKVSGQRKVNFAEPNAPGNSAEPMTRHTLAKPQEATKLLQSAPPTAKPSLARRLSRNFSRNITASNSTATEKLEKLELQCCPQETVPKWMIDGKLKPSKKLYIRGGNLRTLRSGPGDVTWKVKILCLKYLADLEMDWGELRRTFPDLVYLEKSRSPKLTFFPCNSSGVWINTNQEKSNLLDEASFLYRSIRIWDSLHWRL